MNLLAFALVLAAPLLPPQDTARPASDAYLDAAAEALVRGARARMETVDRSIAEYETVAREHLSLSVSAFRRDRLLLREETAARVLWRREGVGEVEVLGARRVTPVFSREVESGEGAETYDGAPLGLAFDPGGDRFLVFAGITTDSAAIRHPLGAGSESDYRFRSGGSTALRLADGRTIRLRELQVIPRRREFSLLRGSLWLEEETHAVVRGVFQPARPWDIDLDGDEDDEVPGFVKPIRGEIRHVAVEYGLWEGRWWLPRLVSFEGRGETGMTGRLGGVVRYERTYADYRVRGEAGAAELTADPGAGVLSECPEREERGELRCRCEGGVCRLYAVHLPADTASLVDSPYLPPSVWTEGPALFSERELEEITGMLRGLPAAPWELARPEVRWEVAGPALLRYNRVEGLSVGARAEASLPPLTADLTVRMGTAHLPPAGELGVTGDWRGERLRAAAYRRLVPVGGGRTGPGIGNSLNALLFGRDDADYLHAVGVEARGEPRWTAGSGYGWRLYAERQSAAAKGTDLSLPYLFDREWSFRPNLRADPATQAGAVLSLRHARGLDPAGARGRMEAEVEGAVGTFRYLRPSLILGGSVPLPGRLLGAVEVAGGSTLGTLPAQGLWYLGGAETVRGYAPLAAGGEAFWRGRAEVSTSAPLARVVLFSDVGWAGPRSGVRLDPSLLSAGAGVSFLDGIVRLDLARALRGTTGWRAELYLDAVL